MIKDRTVDLAARLRAAIVSRGMKQSWVAEGAGITRATLSNILTGRTPNPSFSVVLAIARVIGEPLADLLGERSEPLSESEREALVRAIGIMENWLQLSRSSPVAATGLSRLAAEVDPIARHDVPSAIARRGARLVFRAIGDSMAEESIRDGDILYVKPTNDIRAADGRIVVCRLDGTLLLRKLMITGRSTRLQSGGGGYVNVSDSNSIEIIGVVVGHLAEM
jgi:transcriptional regulator with XRE-family HTH domain